MGKLGDKLENITDCSHSKKMLNCCSEFSTSRYRINKKNTYLMIRALKKMWGKKGRTKSYYILILLIFRNLFLG